MAVWKFSNPTKVDWLKKKEEMLTSALRVLVNNLYKESFYGK